MQPADNLEMLVSAQIDKICASNLLKKSGVLCTLLRFLASETLRRSPGLTRRSIATKLIRSEPTADDESHVAVNASKLREKIDHYYATEGRDDEIRISLPQNQYLLRIERLAVPEPNASEASSSSALPPVPPVLSVEPGEAQPLAAAAPARRARNVWIGIACLAPCITALLFWKFPAKPASPSDAQLATRIETETFRGEIDLPEGYESVELALSPNGRLLAIADSEGVRRLLVREIGRFKRTELPNTEGARYPFWSPESNRIAYFADHNLFTIDPDSKGVPQPVAPAPDGRGGFWNGDSIVFSPGPQQTLLQVPATGGKTLPFTNLVTKDNKDNQEGHRFPFLIPDPRSPTSERYLFHVLSNTGEAGVYLGFMPWADPKRVLDEETNAIYMPPIRLGENGTLLWRGRHGNLEAAPFNPDQPTFSSRNGQVITGPEATGSLDTTVTGAAAFSVSSNGTLVYYSGNRAQRHLELVDRSGHRLRGIGEDKDIRTDSPIAISPDGKTLAIAIIEQGPNLHSNIVARDTKTGEEHPITTHTLDSNTGGDAWYPVFKDLDWIAYGLQRTNKIEVQIHLAPVAAGQGNRSLCEGLSVNAGPVDWSLKAGKVLLLKGSQQGLWLMPYPGSDTKCKSDLDRRIGSLNVKEGRFRPDGQWIAYASDNSWKASKIYIRGVEQQDEGKPVADGRLPRWNADGSELYYLRMDEHYNEELVAVTFKSTGSGLQPDRYRPLFRTPHVADYVPIGNGEFILNERAPDALRGSIKVIPNWQRKPVE